MVIVGLKRKKEDTFGMKDEDWNVYKAIVSQQLDSVKNFYGRMCYCEMI